MSGHLCRTTWHGRSASGGRDAGDKACTSTLCSTGRIESWHLSMGQGPPRRGPCICSACSAPSVTCRQSSLQFPECATLCLTRYVRSHPRHTLHSSLGIASKKPVRSPGWVLCLSEVPRKPHGPADGTLCAGTKCPSLICPVSRASSPGLDTLWFACVFVE